MKRNARILSIIGPFAAWSVSALVASAAPSTTCMSIQDNAGDFAVSAPTSTMAVSPERGDILASGMRQEDGHWMLSVTTSKPLVLAKDERLSLIFLFDRDRQAKDNYWLKNDARAGADSYYIVAEDGSAEGYGLKREYLDMASRSWKNIATSSTVRITSNTVDVSVPYEELERADSYQWRVALIFGTGKWIVRDGAPDRSDDPDACGYLPIPAAPAPTSVPISRASTSTHAAASADPFRDAMLALFGLAVASIILSKIFNRIDAGSQRG